MLFNIHIFLYFFAVKVVLVNKLKIGTPGAVLNVFLDSMVVSPGKSRFLSVLKIPLEGCNTVDRQIVRQRPGLEELRWQCSLEFGDR